MGSNLVFGILREGEIIGMKPKENVVSALEKFSTAMLASLSCLPVAGLLLALGALLASAGLGTFVPILRWQPLALLGNLIYDGMMAIIQNLGVVFCAGVAAFLARSDKHQAALIAFLSYLVFLTAGHTTLEQLGLLAADDPSFGLYGTGQASVLGIQTVDMGVTGGILLGFVTGWVYNRTCGVTFRPAPLRIYGGARLSFLCMAGLALGLGVASCFVWPPVQQVVNGITGWIASAGDAGLFLYGFLERVLIPTGLHHLVYMPFQFTSLGGTLMVGDQVYAGAYPVVMAQYSLGLPLSDSIRWMYTGFTKTFGYFGIAAAMIFCARPENRRRTAAMLVPLVLTASLALATEPMDFLFCFLSPVLWLAHGAIAGLFMVLLDWFGVTAFTGGLFTSLAMNLSAGPERTNYPVLYLLAGAEILVYFGVFTLLIRGLNLRTPGREAHVTTAPVNREAGFPYQALLAALGGRDNILRLNNCFTRLRIWVKDVDLLDQQLLRDLAPDGMYCQSREVQLVFGLDAVQVRRQLEELLGQNALSTS